MKRPWLRIAFLILMLLPAAFVITLVHLRAPDLVVYCAHDSLYADAVIRDFEAQSGLRVAVKYDSEATKSLGLTELLIYEHERPQCDVFWNNELLGTRDLQTRGLLAAYKGDGYARIPDMHKDADGMWAGFGARMRVYIINTNRCAATYAAVDARLAADDLARVAMARPLYGTTLTRHLARTHQPQDRGHREQPRQDKQSVEQAARGWRRAVQSGEIGVGIAGQKWRSKEARHGGAPSRDTDSPAA